jgi:hypothetical protein
VKLQIEHQHLRLRIDESELARLLAGDRIDMQTHFAQAFSIAFTLRLTQAAEANLAGHADAWNIEVPQTAVRAHADRLPTREGLKFVLSTPGANDPLTLLFDVDVRDSARRRKTS